MSTPTAFLACPQSDPDEYERPRDGATVTVTFTGRLEDGTVFDQQEDASLELDGEQVGGTGFE